MKKHREYLKCREFQYICISFNQEHCIINLLESIKFQVINYGQKYKNSFVLHDDFSIDYTVNATKEWISNNHEVFDEFVINVNNKNLGIKLNYLEAIGSIKSDFYKIIGGDDIFSRNSIYDFIEFSVDKELVFSPIITKKGSNFLYDFSFLRLLFIYRSKFITRRLTRRVNLFSAPGSFINRQIITSSEYKNYLLSSSDMVHEDYLSWFYLIVILKKSFSIYFSETVIYRPKYSKTDQMLDKKNMDFKNTKSIKNVIYNLSVFIIKFFIPGHTRSSLSSQMIYYREIINKTFE